MSDTGMKITQADREAAASGHYTWVSGDTFVPEKMRTGQADFHSMVQAFARHREAVITAAMAQDKARIAELEDALGLAADRLHWASVATPGITHKSAKELLAGWSLEARNVTDT